MAATKKTATKKTATRTSSNKTGSTRKSAAKKAKQVDQYAIEKVSFFGLRRSNLPTIFNDVDEAYAYADVLNNDASFVTYYAPVFVGSITV